MAEGLRAIGVPEDLVIKQCSDRHSIEIWPENWQAIQVFCALAATQWLLLPTPGGTPVVTGLRYEAIPVIYEAYGVKRKQIPDLFHCLQVMERAALAILNNRDRGDHG